MSEIKHYTINEIKNILGDTENIAYVEMNGTMIRDLVLDPIIFDYIEKKISIISHEDIEDILGVKVYQRGLKNGRIVITKKIEVVI